MGSWHKFCCKNGSGYCISNLDYLDIKFFLLLVKFKVMNKKTLRNILIFFILLGFIDSVFLTHKHYYDSILVCGTGPFANCGEVLKSKYSILFGVPLALWGVLNYLIIAYLFSFSNIIKSLFYKRLLFFQTAIAFIFSLYLLFLQAFVIKAFCPYCLVSAASSTIIYFVSRILYSESYFKFRLEKIEFFYKLFAKPLFFLMNPEFVHEQAFFWGNIFGKVSFFKSIFSYFLVKNYKNLNQKIEKIDFKNPIGLAAGYDYESAFLNILPACSMGFETVGTISNKACEGNKKPRLGRLPKSKSLLVNKGFKNPGADEIIEKIENRNYQFPFGVSIGRTNDSSTMTLEKAITDIVSAFKKFESSQVNNSYYELNISCPNLKGNLSLYPPKNIRKLLQSLSKLKIKKPVFVKMPIEKTDKEVKSMLEEISKHKFIKGVIFGNLQKDRNHHSIDKNELKSLGKGNFSGKPTFKRSNELIRLAYKNYSKRFVIIGCGGVFNACDAYEKIKSGASLVQMITGMVFEGPQVVAQINSGLSDLIERDGYKNISEAVGSGV